jgi:hypothetical protein
MERPRKQSSINFLRAGWWLIHVLGISLFYVLGHMLWR